MSDKGGTEKSAPGRMAGKEGQCLIQQHGDAGKRRAVSEFAYRHIRSFRREDGGLYAVYSAVYYRAYRLRMTSLHKRGRHSKPMGNRRCTWCGEAAS